MNGTDIDWTDILPEPFVLLELGARGEGKTALGHRLLEVFGGPDADRDAYIMGFPEHKRDLLPDWLTILDPNTPQGQWPEDSIVLIHEAHQLMHARRSMNAENLNLDELVTVSRHKNSNIIYDTQQSHRLDKNAVAAVDGICVRWPALMQEDFERRAVKPIINDARDALSKYVNVVDEDDFTFVERMENEDGVDELKKHVYVHADQFRGEYPHEVELADHWSEKISKAYGGGGAAGGNKDIDDIRADMAKPEEIEEKSVGEVVDIIGDEIGEGEDTEETTETAETTDTSGAEMDGDEFIERLVESEGRVIPNDYGKSIVELVVPESIREETTELVNNYDMDPASPDIFPQSPSFTDRIDEAPDNLTAYQFLLSDADKLGTSGYDVEAIIDGMEGEPFLLTKASQVEASLPV